MSDRDMTEKRSPQVPAARAATYEEVKAEYKFYFNIVKRRKWWFLISLAIILLGIVSLVLQGLNFGVDFTGGTLINMRFDQPVTQAQVSAALESVGLAGTVQLAPDGQNAIIRTDSLSEEKRSQLLTALGDVASFDQKNFQEESVGPAMGKELRFNAILSLSIAAVLMLIYIAFRFQLLFAISGIVALFHDILIVIAFFSIFQWDVNATFVAAVLTVFGYSINDTVVIFDRIRENEGRMKKRDDYEEMVEKSIWQTMRRSINTAITVLIVLLALLIFGGESIKTFTVAMTIGVISGVYSSVFIASPLLLELKKRFGVRGKRSVKTA